MSAATRSIPARLVKLEGDAAAARLVILTMRETLSRSLAEIRRIEIEIAELQDDYAELKPCERESLVTAETGTP
ncbi:MAG: hypothetical protein ACKVT0_03415 [Planctomycetaceae bacterium]